MDIELKTQLENINKNIVTLQKGGVWWRSLLHGVMTGLGSIFGVVIALTLIGWMLNIAGIIPAFRKEAGEWRQLIEQAQDQRIPTKAPSAK